MAAVLSGAWGLFQGASQFKNMFRDFNKFIQLLSLENDADARRLLVRLGRRVDAIAQPLGFCLSWSQGRATCIADVVFQAKLVLQQVESFLGKCVEEMQHNGALRDRDAVISILHDLLRDMDFAVSSLTLALGLITASLDSQSSESSVRPKSLGTLLRASYRIQAMHCTSGDVILCTGTFLINDDAWVVENELVTMKIYRDSHRRLYELRIEAGCKGQVETAILDLDASLDFRLSLLSEFDNLPAGQVQAGTAALAFHTKLANAVQKRYLLVVDETKREAGSVSALDFAYTARLCIFENRSKARSDTALHTMASDEELELALQGVVRMSSLDSD